MPVPETSPVVPPEAVPTPRWRTLLLALVSARRAGSLLTHSLLAVPTSMLPSLAFLGLAYGLLHLLGIDATPFTPPRMAATFREFFGAVIFAPLVETLLLAGLLGLLSSMSARPVRVAAVSSLLWGGLHGLFGLLWFFGTFWSFYVLSCSYLAWRPAAWWKACVAAALPHALINLTAFGLVMLGL